MDVLGLEVFVSSVVVGRMLCCPPENEIVTKKKTSQRQHQKKMIKPKYQNKQGKVAESSIFVVVHIQPFMLLCGPCDPLMGQGSQGSNRISKEQMWHNWQVKDCCWVFSLQNCCWVAFFFGGIFFGGIFVLVAFFCGIFLWWHFFGGILFAWESWDAWYAGRCSPQHERINLQIKKKIKAKT